MSRRCALVLGGSGAVGACVVQQLRIREVAVTFTWLNNRTAADAVERETGAAALRIDLRDSSALRTAIRALDPSPDLLVHCASMAPLAPLAQISDTDWDDAHAVNTRSVFAALQCLPRVRDVVLLGALDRSQSLPLPLPFAATQGALSAMAMALAQELGPQTRVNLVALGPLTSGLSARLPAALPEAYLKYSALGRLGTPQEAARAIVWLALDNQYMSGKILPVCGGI